MFKLSLKFLQKLKRNFFPFYKSKELKIIFKTLQKGFSNERIVARFVGGCVRKHLLGENIDDIDIATILTTEQIKEKFKDTNFKVVETGVKHGTITLLSDKNKFELTTLRKDVTTDGRHAEIEYTDNWQLDSERRDFTFNAIYLNMKGEILDPLGNFSDLVNGKVRFVGQPKKRIEEDHLRILRFFRFISKYPSQNSSINLKTLAAIKQSKYLLKKLSKDRIWKEFKLILSSDGVCLALRFMKETGVLNILFSSISLKNIGNLVELEKKIISEFLGKHYFNTFEFKDPILRLSILLDPKEKYLERVLSLKKNEIKKLNFYNKFDVFPKNFKSLGFNYGLEKGLSLLLLYIAKKKNFDIYIKSKTFEIEFQLYCKDIIEGAKAVKKFPITGIDLLQRGYSGKKIGEILEKLKKVWINSEFKLNKKKLLSKS